MAEIGNESDIERMRKNQLLGTPGKHDSTYYLFSSFNYEPIAMIGHYSRHPPRSKYYYRMAYNAMSRTVVPQQEIDAIINRQAYWAMRRNDMPVQGCGEDDDRHPLWLDSMLMPCSNADLSLTSTLLIAREAERDEKAARGRELGVEPEEFKQWQTPIPAWDELYDDQKRRPHSHELVTLPMVSSSPAFSLVDLFCEENGIALSAQKEEDKQQDETDTLPYGNQEQEKRRNNEENDEWGSDIDEDELLLNEADYCSLLRDKEIKQRRSLAAGMAYDNAQRVVDKAIARDGKVTYDAVNRMRQLEERKKIADWEYEIAVARVEVAEEKITLDADEKALARATTKMCSNKALGVSVIQWAMSGKLSRYDSLKRKAEAEEEWGYYSAGEEE